MPVEGTFLDVLKRYLEKEGINFSFDVDKITISIEEPVESKGIRIIEKKELAFVENIENCEIWEIFYQLNPQIKLSILRKVPDIKHEILQLKKYKDKEDLGIGMFFSIYEGPLDIPGGVFTGEVANEITIKDTLKRPAIRNETQIIYCRCERKDDIGIRMYCTLENRIFVDGWPTSI